MKLKQAMDLAFESNENWRIGKGKKAARINADHVLRILGEDFEVDDTNSHTFAYITKVLKEENYAAGTINRITSVLSKLLTELAQTGHQVPVVKFKRQSEKSGRPDFYREDEMELILNAAKRRDDFMLLHDSIVFALKTGCRQGEMLRLTFNKVDMERREILFEDTKNGTDHWLTMNKDLVPVLQRRAEYDVDGRVFPWDSHQQLLAEFKKAVKEAGLKEGRVWHTIRHTTATWLCERGVPLRSVMGVLNHANVQTTLRYAKASDKAVAAAIDLL